MVGRPGDLNKLDMLKVLFFLAFSSSLRRFELSGRGDRLSIGPADELLRVSRKLVECRNELKREPAVCDLREIEGRLGWVGMAWAFAEWGADKPTGEGTGEGEIECEAALKSEMESGRAAPSGGTTRSWGFSSVACSSRLARWL